MSSKPWFAWFPSDYRAKTAHLTFEQDSAYRRLLDAYYERRGPLPCDALALYRIAGAQSVEERKAVTDIAKEFFTNGDGVLRHPRCDEQIAKEAELHAKWSEAGRKGGLRQAQARLKGRLKHPNLTPILIPRPIPTSIQRHSAAKAAFNVPEWIPRTQWEAWIEARKKRRNAPTDWALSLAIAKLENLKEQGESPAAVLAQSAFRGWAGLFPVKEGS